MKHYLRLLLLILTQRRRARCTLAQGCTSAFRVWPNDLDVFMHMNNGVYLTMADLGRMDLMLRSGTYAPIRERGWYPVVAAETIRFRRSLRPFQRYTIATRVAGWGERSVYLEQTFESGGKLVARALIDARFLGRGGERIAVERIGEAVGLDPVSPPLPEHVQAWIDAERPVPEPG